MSDTIVFCSLSASKYSFQANKHTALHEIGHAQYPYIRKIISLSALPLSLLIEQKFGKYRGTMFYLFYYCIAHQLEERRADNFANKYADEQCLRAAIEKYQYYKQTELDSLSNNQLIQYLCQRIFMPLQPTVNSRIRKIRQELKKRDQIKDQMKQ